MAYTISNENYRRSSEYETRGTNDGRGGDMDGRYSRGAATLPTIKLVLVGDQSVGKSSLIARYTKGDFAGEHNTVATVGVEFFSRIVTVGGGHGDVRVQVWDTAGQEKHRSLTKQVFRGARGVMIVYDITNRNSFESLPLWLSEIKAEVHATCSFLLVGNKYDLVVAASSSNVSTSPPQPAFASPSSFAPYGRGGGGGTNTPQFGSDRSIPPSPSNYNYPDSNNNNNSRQRGLYGGSPQTPPPPIPLSPPHRFSSAGIGGQSSQSQHQRTMSSSSTGANVEKYTFTSGGAGSTPTSNSQCTTPSNQHEGGGGSRSRNNDYYANNNRGVSPRESGIDGRGGGGGWGDGNAVTRGSNNYNNNNYVHGSISSQKGSNYQNNNRYDPVENWGSPPRDMGQTQRFVYTSGGQGSTSTPPLVPARRPSGSSNTYGNYYGSPDYSTSRNPNNNIGNYNNINNSRSGSDRPTYSGGGGGGLRSGSANGNVGPTGMMNAARGIINSRSRQVTLKEADEFARSNGMSFLETSAKDRTNVERAFLWLIQNVMETSGGYMPSPSNGALGGVAGGSNNNNNYLQAGTKNGDASASNSTSNNNNANFYGYNMKTNRNSVNLSGKDRPRGAGEGYVAKKRRKGEESDDEGGEKRSSGCPC